MARLAERLDPYNDSSSISGKLAVAVKQVTTKFPSRGPDRSFNQSSTKGSVMIIHVDKTVGSI